MKRPRSRDIGTEAKLLLIGIPVLIWTLLPLYHMLLFAISPKETAFSGRLWPDNPTLHNFTIVFKQQHYLSAPFLAAALEFAADRGRDRRDHAVHRDLRRFRDQPAEGARAAGR